MQQVPDIPEAGTLISVYEKGKPGIISGSELTGVCQTWISCKLRNDTSNSTKEFRSRLLLR